MRKLPLLLGFILFLSACASRSPLERLKKELDRYPEYSIILEDMQEEGNFFKEYYHRYRLVYGQKQSGSDTLTFQTEITDWLRVDRKEYQKFFPYLGMVLASKTADGKIDDMKYPPGYQYVGDPRYGRWRTDSQGNSFWEWYGKFALMSHLFGMFSRPVYRTDWDTFRDYRRRGDDYFGRGNSYGTNGTYTRATKPNFYQRRMARERASKSSFSQKVKQRVRRSNLSGLRSRSSRGFGK